MRVFRIIFGISLMLILAGCAGHNKFRTYDGPEVTRILVFKDSRRMYLMHHEQVLTYYDIDLGFAPKGDKTIEGDGRTPEGDYIIDRRNPNSVFHLSLGVSYPDEDDIAEAEALGKDPGGDIFIHGRGPRFKNANADWTWGCIAVSDDEIEEIYAMVRNETPISIRP